jgi:hypothetical protein
VGPESQDRYRVSLPVAWSLDRRSGFPVLPDDGADPLAPPAFSSTDTAAALARSSHPQDGTPAESSAVTSDGTLMLTARDDDGSVGAPLLFPDLRQG